VGIVDDEKTGNRAAQCPGDGIANEIEQPDALTR
jgi:hypothetical protein